MKSIRIQLIKVKYEGKKIATFLPKFYQNNRSNICGLRPMRKTLLLSKVWFWLNLKEANGSVRDIRSTIYKPEQYLHDRTIIQENIQALILPQVN